MIARLRDPRPGSRSRHVTGRTDGPSPPTAEGTVHRRAAGRAGRQRPIHRQRPVRVVRSQAERARVAAPRRFPAVVRRYAHRLPHVPQGGARRGVQAGAVKRRRPSFSPPTGAHGLPFATMTRPTTRPAPVSYTHLTLPTIYSV